MVGTLLWAVLWLFCMIMASTGMDLASFDLMEATIEQLGDGLQQNHFTSMELVTV